MEKKNTESFHSKTYARFEVAEPAPCFKKFPVNPVGHSLQHPSFSCCGTSLGYIIWLTVLVVGGVFPFPINPNLFLKNLGIHWFSLNHPNIKKAPFFGVFLILNTDALYNIKKTSQALRAQIAPHNDQQSPNGDGFLLAPSKSWRGIGVWPLG